MRQWSVNGAEYVFHFVYKLISFLSYGHIFCPAFDPQYFGIPFSIPLPEERQYAADETPLVYIPIRLLLTFKIRSLQPEFLSFKKPKNVSRILQLKVRGTYTVAGEVRRAAAVHSNDKRQATACPVVCRDGTVLLFQTIWRGKTVLHRTDLSHKI